jgi:hypothetical protein
MKKKQSLDRRLMISKNSILMLVVLVSVFLAIWAWFSSNQSATATGLSVSTKTPNTLDIALVEKVDGEEKSYKDTEFTSSINLDQQMSVVRTMITDVTSDGVNFIIPTTNQTNGVRQVEGTTENNWTRAAKNSEYLSIPIYVRSQTPEIYVSGSSKLEATLKDANGDVENKSDAGDFSRNGIAGAVRVSIVDMTKSIEEDTTYNPTDTDAVKLLWIPRPDIYLDTSGNEWELKTLSANDIINKKTNIHSYYQINNSEDKSSGVSSGTGVAKLEVDPTDTNKPINVVASTYGSGSSIPTLGSNQEIATTSDVKWTSDDTTYYIYKFAVNIWIEGEDSEARRALNNGKFKLYLDFCTNEDNS